MNHYGIAQKMLCAKKSFYIDREAGVLNRAKQDIAMMLAAEILENHDLFTVHSDVINGETITTVELCFAPMTEQDIKRIHLAGVHNGQFGKGRGIDFLPVSLLGKGGS